MKKPNVLILCPFFRPNLGGVETHLDLLTKYLSTNGYQTIVLTCKPLMTKIDYLSYEKKKNLEIFRFWWFAKGLFDKTTPYPLLQFFYIIPGLLFWSFLYLFRHHNQFDVVHAHGFASGFITRVITLFFPIKRKVISTHFIYPPMNPTGIPARIFRWVFSGFDKILLIGEASGRQLRDLGVDGTKMKVFHHWLDPKKFFPKDKFLCRKKLGLSQAKMVILFAGRVLRMKGIFTLLEVAQSLPREIVFVFVGDGPDMIEFEKKARKIENVVIAGRQPHQKMVDFLGAADFLILPSLTEEAQPLVIMESLMCGRPVVATNKGAVGEMFGPEVGLTIAPTSVTIKKAILDLYNYPDKLKSMQNKARKFALQKYGQRNAKIITDTYR